MQAELDGEFYMVVRARRVLKMQAELDGKFYMVVRMARRGQVCLARDDGSVFFVHSDDVQISDGINKTG